MCITYETPVARLSLPNPPPPSFGTMAAPLPLPTRTMQHNIWSQSLTSRPMAYLLVHAWLLQWWRPIVLEAWARTNKWIKTASLEGRLHVANLES